MLSAEQKSRSMKKLFTCFILFATTLHVYAGGYQVNFHGQKQTGMGMAGTSLTEDGSSSFNNPGGLAMMVADHSVLAGMSFISSHSLFHLEGSMHTARTENPPETPFYFYGAGRITDNLVAGIAVNTPFSNNLKWEEGWAGRFLIEEMSFQTITIQPAVSYLINDMLSIGAGVVYALGNVDMKKCTPIPSNIFSA